MKFKFWEYVLAVTVVVVAVITVEVSINYCDRQAGCCGGVDACVCKPCGCCKACKGKGACVCNPCECCDACPGKK